MMQSNNCGTALRYLTILVSTCLAPLVSTAAVIENWDVSTSAEWVPANTNDMDAFINPTLLSWGSGAQGPSTLSIVPDSQAQPATASGVSTIGVNGRELGDVDTVVPLFSLIHANNPLDARPVFAATALRLEVELTPSVGGPSTMLSVTIPVDFNETANLVDAAGVPTGEACAANTPPPCVDIFVIDRNVALNASFEVDDIEYFFSSFPIDENSIATLAAQECIDSGATNGCVGFTTQEQANTQVDFAATISAEPIRPVPVPGAFVLFAGALAGASVLARAKNRATHGA